MALAALATCSRRRWSSRRRRPSTAIPIALIRFATTLHFEEITLDGFPFSARILHIYAALEDGQAGIANSAFLAHKRRMLSTADSSSKQRPIGT